MENADIYSITGMFNERMVRELEFLEDGLRFSNLQQAP